MHLKSVCEQLYFWNMLVANNDSQVKVIHQ